MLFHTWDFAIFFVVTYTVYLLLRHTRYWLHWLFVASYFFYGWWNPLYLILIFYSTAVNFYSVVLMQRGRHRKLWFTIGAVNSLAVLGFFKYAGFAAADGVPERSLVSIEGRDVHLSCWKRSESGDGWAVRVYSLADKA